MIVVKIGGAEGIDYDTFLEDFTGFEDTVLIHGGSSELNKISEQLGKPPKFIRSPSGHTSRRTDRETLEIFNIVYCGKMNKMIVEKLQRQGVKALGLSGMDGKLLQGKRKNIIAVENGKKKVIRDDYTGTVEKVNTGLLNLLIESEYLPVISPPAVSYQNEAINVDGDRAAAKIAGALHSKILVILSNTPGLLRNIEDEDSLIENIPKVEIDRFMEKYAEGRMKKKVLAAKEALEQGVEKVVLADARKQNPVTAALKGQGTVIK